MIISIINTKGGTAKTTTAIYLAQALHQKGLNVTLIDLDKQGSATDWADRANDTNNPLPYPVEITNLHRLPKLLQQTNTDGAAVIIDTPPGDPTTIDTAAHHADFIIIPVQASAIEVERMWNTLPLANTRPHAVLITSARQGTKNLTDLQTTLHNNNINTFTTHIPIREHIRNSYGTTPTNLAGYDTIAQDIIDNTP